MTQILLKVFLFPGEFVCRLLKAEGADDRAMIRTMINMLVWNAVVVVTAAIITLR